nr:Chain P, 2A peptide [synthetic construct]
ADPADPLAFFSSAIKGGGGSLV